MTKSASAIAFAGNLPIALEIERFLDGDTDGSLVLDALYGSVADEPIPQRLLRVVRDAALRFEIA
jgi:hypothetical protein